MTYNAIPNEDGTFSVYNLDIIEPTFDGAGNPKFVIKELPEDADQEIFNAQAILDDKQAIRDAITNAGTDPAVAIQNVKANLIAVIAEKKQAITATLVNTVPSDYHPSVNPPEDSTPPQQVQTPADPAQDLSGPTA